MPLTPIGVADKVNAPVLGLYGGADTDIPPKGARLLFQQPRCPDVAVELNSIVSAIELL